jgi:anti-sigma B factor antagonist
VTSAQVSQHGESTVVTVEGEVDAYTVPAVRGVLERMALSRGSRVVLDLRPVTFIDSSGLGAIVQLHQRLAQVDGTLRLVCDGVSLRLVELMHLGEVMGVSTSLEEAVAP